jgi:Mannosyl-glycoprotein endo-beta-N-acetylglucosaminidase
MLRKVGALYLFAFILAPMATAASGSSNLPDIMVTPANAVPACVTPGRLMAYVQTRNPKLDPRYENIAIEYMRQGEMLGLRWDYAFYQMIVETGALSYWRGNRAGDVKPAQNNFAGLGATGKGERGESFPDVQSGVRAHLEHLLLYAGRPVENPVAQRTRNIRDWGVLAAWHQTFTRPISYADMATRWAQSKTYATMLKVVADRFDAEICNGPDPRPAMVQEARKQQPNQQLAKAAEPPVANVSPPPAATKVAEVEPRRQTGLELAQQAIEQAKADSNNRRSALGAPPPVAPAEVPTAPAAAPLAAPPAAPFKVLNAPASAPPEAPSQINQPLVPSAAPAAPPAAPKAPPVADVKASAPPANTVKMAPPETKTAPPEKNQRTAMAAPAAKAKMIPETAAPPAANQRCRVWTASYGGQKAMIIRSIIDQVVNFTVLDVNEGSETREAEAFISAYAKNGRIAGEYTSQATALDKAFELCPEG